MRPGNRKITGTKTDKPQREEENQLLTALHEYMVKKITADGHDNHLPLTVLSSPFTPRALCTPSFPSALPAPSLLRLLWPGEMLAAGSSDKKVIISYCSAFPCLWSALSGDCLTTKGRSSAALTTDRKCRTVRNNHLLSDEPAASISPAKAAGRREGAGRGRRERDGQRARAG